jgi:AcrR family transcriptional regulator
MVVRSKLVDDKKSIGEKKVSARRTSKVTSKPSADEMVLAAAEKLFAQHGFEAVTTKALAIEAGVTIGAIYHYFPSKEALYDATTHRVFSRRPAAPKEAFDESGPREARLTLLVLWFVAAIIGDKIFGLLLRRELLDPRPDAPILVDIEVFRDAVSMFKQLIREIVPTADPDEALASMLALVFGFANVKGIYAVVPSVRETLGTPEKIADHATRLLLRGLQPQ